MTREDPQLKLRLPDGMRDRLKAEAERNKRSMNAEIVARLEETLMRQDDQSALENAIANEVAGDNALEEALGHAIRGVLRTHGLAVPPISEVSEPSSKTSPGKRRLKGPAVARAPKSP